MEEYSVYYELVKYIIKLHDDHDFKLLSKHISEAVVHDEDSWFNEKRYTEVCRLISNGIGESSSVEHLSDIERISTTLTLWSVKYSKCDYDVLWKVVFDNETEQVSMITIEWED